MNRSLSRSLAIIAVGSTLPPVRHTRSYLSSPTPTRTSCRETGLNGSRRNTASDIGSYERRENDFDKTLAITSYLQKTRLRHRSRIAPDAIDGPETVRFRRTPRIGHRFRICANPDGPFSRASVPSRDRLPGEYNTYSGASKITPDDAHAWSEIYFRGAGWIPFNASTRPDLPTAADIEQAPTSGLSSLLDRRFGDSHAAAAGQTPGALLKTFEFAVEHGANWGLFALTDIGFGAMLVWSLFFRRKKSSNRPVQFDYSVIDGDDRKVIIASFVSAEKRLANNGFRRRMKNEPYREYAFAAQDAAGEHAKSLYWLADAASRAAFLSTNADANKVNAASDRAGDLRSALG